MSDATPSYTELLALIGKFRGRRVLLIGDMVADHYIFGKTARISREAPVLILKYQQETVVPGQAANTASNISALGGEVFPVGLLGRDTAGRQLKGALRSRRIRTDLLIERASVRTLTKTRILAGGHHTCRQQVIRIDDDERLPVDGATKREVIRRIKSHGATADAIVISDYGYNLLSEEVWQVALELKQRRGIPVILDSRYNFSKLHGATMITPNEGEAVECCGLSVEDNYEIADIARRLRRITGSDNVLVTRGNEGMVLLPKGKNRPYTIPIFGPDEVTDVTGAGDTVVAAVSLSLAAGSSPLNAAQLANIAAGLAVMKIGTATVSQAELRAAIIGAPKAR